MSDRELEELRRKLAETEMREAMLRATLRSFGSHRQFATPCFCQNVDKTFCVGMPECKEVNRILAETPEVIQALLNIVELAIRAHRGRFTIEHVLAISEAVMKLDDARLKT